MDELTCPQCQDTMTARSLGHVTVHRCAGCGGIFLANADLGALVEAENDWHAHQSANTARLPRISADMPAPASVPRSRAYLETLFRA